MQRLPVMLNSEFPSVRSGEMPLSHNDDLNRSYGHFYSLANAQPHRMAFCSAHDFVGDGTVSGYWIPHNWQWAPVHETIEASQIFDKVGDMDAHCIAVIDRCAELGLPIFGHVGLSRFTSSKWASYEAFAEHHALTARIEPAGDSVEAQLDAFFDEMDRTYAVHHEAALLKPTHGWESRGIYMVTREPAGLRLKTWWGQEISDGAFIHHILGELTRMPYVIQTLVDTSPGIPELGLHAEKHDARFVFFISANRRAELIQCYVKTRTRGMLYYEAEQFPQAALDRVHAVADEVARRFPYGIFSVDVMRDVSGDWFLTELNDQVGFNIHWHQSRDFEGVDQLMRAYLREIRAMATSPGEARYASAF